MAIIQKIMIDLITDVVSFIQIPPFPKEITELDQISDLAATEAVSHTLSVMEGDGFAYSFMNKEVFDALRSIFVIANPRKEYLKKELYHCIQFAKKP